MSSVAWRERRLSELLSDHNDAVGDFIDRARAIPDSGWLVPRAEGKWTPAQETRHLILYYDALSADLKGLRKMGLRGTPLKRFTWRLFALGRILRSKRIHVAVKTMREIRPGWEETARDPLLALLRERVQDFDALFTDSWRSTPGRTVTHPFFGNLKLDHAMRFSAVHTRHHSAFLPAPPLP